MTEQKKRRLTAKGSREKGLKFEREIVAYIKQQLGLDIARGVAGAQAFDRSKGSSDIFGLPSLAVEAKRTERFNLTEFMDQAVRNATGGDMAAVVHRFSRQSMDDASVVMRFSDFLVIYRAYLHSIGVRTDDQQEEVA